MGAGTRSSSCVLLKTKPSALLSSGALFLSAFIIINSLSTPVRHLSSQATSATIAHVLVPPMASDGSDFPLLVEKRSKK